MREKNLRERDRERDDAAGSADGAPGSNLTRIRSEATANLAAADAAIDRALSSDSTAFIAASRQSGGQ